MAGTSPAMTGVQISVAHDNKPEKSGERIAKVIARAGLGSRRGG